MNKCKWNGETRCGSLMKIRLGSLIRPKVTRSVHFCPTTKKFMERRYADMTSMDAFPTSSVYPTKVGTPPSPSFLSTLLVALDRMKMEICWKQNMAFRATWIIKPLSFKKSRKKLRLVNCLVRSMSLLMRISSINAKYWPTIDRSSHRFSSSIFSRVIVFKSSVFIDAYRAKKVVSRTSHFGKCGAVRKDQHWYRPSIRIERC